MVDKNISTPLYTQVADKLRQEILAKQYGEQGCIGTHAQLAERFSVSLRTIRTAVQGLEKEGLVDIHQGKGTFVRRTMLVDQLRDLTGISDLLDSMGVEKEVSVPDFRLLDTPSWLPQDVQEALGKQCLYIRRVVAVGGVPAAVTSMYLPDRFFAQMTREEVVASTVYQIYQNKLGMELGRGRQSISAAGADPGEAADLRIPEGSPVLRVVRKAYDSHKDLIEFMVLTYEASKYSFEVELELSKQR